MEPLPFNPAGHATSGAAEVERRTGAERRGAPRPGSTARRAEDRGRILRGMLAAVLALCGAAAVLYAFLAAIGSIDPADAVVATVVALVLASIWLAGFAYRLRTQAERAQRHDRERRGF